MAIIEQRMDMDKINPIHQEAAEEVLNIIDDFKDLSNKDLKEKIKEAFNLKLIQEKPIHTSVWENSIKGFDKKKLGISIQGWIKKTENGKLIKVPIFNLNTDLDTLNDLVNHIVKKYSSIVK
jgi:hypothetical protein